MHIDRAECDVTGLTEPHRQLQSEKPRILSEIHNQTGSERVTKRSLEFAPVQVVEISFNSEYGSNWWDAHELADEESTLHDENVVGSHTGT